MDGIRFRLDLKLQNLSMISIAEKLWDSQDIKNRIKNHFSGQGREYPDKNWCEISKLVVLYANSINLPASLSGLLKNTILFIGHKIYDWIFYVTNSLELDLIFTQKIYFSFGVVDEIKIFDSYWRDLMAADDFVYQSKYFRHSPLFSLVCIYGRERFVKERKNEMLDELSKFYPEIKTGDEIYNIISVSICLTLNKSIIENVASPQRMFEECLEAGFNKAARFFWEKLDKVEKVLNLTNFAKKCFRNTHGKSYIMEKHSENLLFLINQMGEEERCLFFTDYADEIITLILPIWPYQELIVDMDLLKYDWNIESSRLKKLPYYLISFSKIMNGLEFPMDNDLVFQIMKKAWRNLPFYEKSNCLGLYHRIIPTFFLTFNLDILNLLFNDPSIRKVNSRDMYSYVKYGFLALIKTGKYDFLNEIIEKVLNFVPEPKELLKEYISYRSFVKELMENDESFALLDQFLDWLTESKAERASLKEELNTIFYCRSLSGRPDFKFELADKFLKWKLESDAEVESFKDAMKSYNFVIIDHLEYVRIKSGDLSWLRPGDSLVMHPKEDPLDNAEGLTFLKFEEATELNRGVVLGTKSFCSGVNYDFLGPDGYRATAWHVDYVGTKVGDFIVFTVLRIWSDSRESYFNIESIVNLCNRFIKLYYETDEEVLKFKKTKLQVLVTENRMGFLLDVLKCSRVFPENFLDDFCEFCMIPSEKIDKIKIQHRRDIEEFLDTYLIDQLCFRLVDIYLNWLFGDFKKTEVCKKFLNSSNKGALLWVSFWEQWVKSHDDWNPDICRWLSLVDDIEKLKNDVFALNEDSLVCFPDRLETSADLNFTADWPVGK